jgi:flavin reductase (DIM6/NTAB) family NADH-FMN oxidoreductase RutF
MEELLFKNYMSRIPASVSVIGVMSDSQILGCTISSLVSVNVVKPELLFVLRNGSTVLNAISQHRVFSINVLSDKQKDIADYYSSARDVEFLSSSKHPWKEFVQESIVLEKSQVSFVCRLKEQVVLEGSTVNFCTPETVVESVGDSPLIYANRNYFSLSILS